MGERFRSAYSELDSLRSLVPAAFPVLAMSATFTPVGLETASKVLEIDLKRLSTSISGYQSAPSVLHRTIRES